MPSDPRPATPPGERPPLPPPPPPKKDQRVVVAHFSYIEKYAAERDAARAESSRLRAALDQIEAIASGSTTANSLAHIARIARGALGKDESR